MAAAVATDAPAAGSALGLGAVVGGDPAQALRSAGDHHSNGGQRIDAQVTAFCEFGVCFGDAAGRAAVLLWRREPGHTKIPSGWGRP